MGQFREIKTWLSKIFPNLSDCPRVVTVDDYQGEENKVRTAFVA